MGRVKCISANSTLTRWSPLYETKDTIASTTSTVSSSSQYFIPTNATSTVPDTSPTQVSGAPIPANHTSDSAKRVTSHQLPHYGVALISIGALAILSGIILCYIRVRKSRRRAFKNASLVELPLGGHNEKTELAVHERPVELPVGSTKTSEYPSTVAENSVVILPSAHIVDVEDLGEFDDGIIQPPASKVTLPCAAGSEEVPSSDFMKTEEIKKTEDLQIRLDKVKGERQRLSRMQELEELENVLKEELSKKQKGLGTEN